ncbi:pyrroloquinoline-quinone synthase PqqC [Streptomyces longwoodensis]|uniref:pyrroloquinoline-quinone synthase PqqC n=1 Tax=Streptomyces longwoodensis TaxID=68231 RepID=UPI0033C54D5B
MRAPLPRDAFESALRELSAKYWDKHPFHVRLHAGESTAAEIRSWVANRWYYQRNLSQKNAAIIANCPLLEVRRRWVERIVFQDGSADSGGGLADWRTLAEAVGLSWEEVRDERHLLPGVRFAVDAYVNFCRTSPWTESAGAALTELFAPGLMAARVAVWQEYYPWIDPSGHAYFQRRIPVVSGDSAYTLDLVLTHCSTRNQQEAALAALGFKCDVLWAMLDAIAHATTEPGA